MIVIQDVTNVLDVSMRIFIIFLYVIWHFWPICLYFKTYFMEFKMGVDQGFHLMNDVVV